MTGPNNSTWGAGCVLVLAGDDRWFVVPAGIEAIRPLATGLHHRALRRGLRHYLFYAFKLRPRRQRPHLSASVERIADTNLLSPLTESRHEFVVDARLHNDP